MKKWFMWGVPAVILSFTALIFVLWPASYAKQGEIFSPNKGWVIEEYLSLSEAGHAPYGTELRLSSNFSLAQTYVFFAGYCRSLKYQWLSDEKILVECNVQEAELIMTMAIKVDGIKIEYRIED